MKSAWFIGVTMVASSLIVVPGRPEAMLQVAPECPATKVGETGNIEEYCGIKWDLYIFDLDELGLEYERDWGNGEGIFYPIAHVKAYGTDITLHFTDDGFLYRMETETIGAQVLQGIGVGSTLAELKSRWPEQNLYWASAHGTYAAFNANGNLYFEFDPADLPDEAFELLPLPRQLESGEWVSEPSKAVKIDPERLRVTTIRIEGKHD